MLLMVYGRNAVRNTFGVRLILNKFKNYFSSFESKNN